MRAKDLLVSAGLLLAGRRRPKATDEPIVPPGPEEPRAELAVLALLGAAIVCAVAFVAIYALDRLPAQTQLLGLALGLALLFVAAALIVTGKKLVVSEELEDDYPVAEHPADQETIAQVLAEGGSRLTRRSLFKLTLGATGAALGVAFVTPFASLGPVLGTGSFLGTPWKRGRRLVDENGKPWRADDIEENDFYTAFPEGADKEALGSALVLVRPPAGSLKLSGRNAGFDAHGIVAYSKICTHAGCAISIYRAPLFARDEPSPALVCPCHYSTFDPATGGTVLFGPAGRKLPMLPLTVDRHGYLRATGNFDEPVGPSWWGVRMRKASPS